MTSIMKAAMFAALTMMLAFPALAAERTMTKGTKTYQSAQKPDAQESNNASQEQSGDVTQIEPAAGADLDVPEQKGKSFKEEMRLPRKN